jgi:adenosylhomocysteine nucleosidase
MQILVVIPIKKELDFFRQSCLDLGLHAETVMVGKLLVTRFPELGIVVGTGGLGKTQFAVQTQYMIDVGPGWDVVICAGAAGALDDALAVGDVVIATETVEHDIRNRFGKPLLPRFSGDPQMIASLQAELPPLSGFRAHFGPVASGDEDVIEPHRRADIRERTGALVVAWEGAGGARACQFSGVPYLEIRGVTDKANSAAATDFAANLAVVMRNIAVLLTTWAKSLHQ